ncbi:MAG: hypothetical protein NTW00_04580 [Hyphomicrobiales bacterium]|nr:hypothetical protein [Hyphomicrobiales bacterium]
MKPILTAAILACALSACNETTTASRAPTIAPGVPIAVDSISGGPDEASVRRVDIVDPATNPRYRVRGYLAAEPTADGQTALSFVWDVFDAQKRRAQRMQGVTVARNSSGDWSGVDQSTVNKAASESMDQIAQFLAGQEQVRAASGTTAAAAPAAARPSSVAAR